MVPRPFQKEKTMSRLKNDADKETEPALKGYGVYIAMNGMVFDPRKTKKNAVLNRCEQA